MPATTWLANSIINHYLRNSAQSAVAPYGLILTADPTVDGLFTNEITGSGYARQALTFDAPALGATQNSAKVSWTIPTSYTSGVTLTHVALATASTAGNMMSYGELSSPTFLNGGDVFSIDTADLDGLFY